MAETETTSETATEATTEIATENIAEVTADATSETASEKEEPTVTDTKDNLLCPKCGSNLVLRTAKRGNNIGEQFYGCLAYPKCRFILKMEE